MKKAIKLLLTAMSLWILLWQPQPLFAQHLMMMTYNLEEMVEAVDRIFTGKVVSAKEDYISAAGGMLPLTIYTFEVDDVLKGNIGKTLSIKQFGHQSSFGGQRIPRYMQGQVVMLFLHPNSEYGLTSPVGLEQGAFLVKTIGGVKVSVINGRRNQGLFERSPKIDSILQAESPAVPHPLINAKGELPYAEFRDLVEKLLKP
jgi:hypothetical protein